MAKRFTDSAKWARQFFQDLTPKHKLIWLYLCDNCDHAGIWDLNLKLISFQVGLEITMDDFKPFGSKVEIKGDKIIIPSFIEYQYGTLNPNNRVHKSVIDKLEKCQNKGLTSPIHRAKDKDKDKEKEKEGESEGKQTEAIPTLVSLWNEFAHPSLSRPRVSTRKRLAAIRRLEEKFSVDELRAAIEAIGKSQFLLGKLPGDKKRWRADFDWFLREDSIAKLLEGAYR